MAEDGPADGFVHRKQQAADRVALLWIVASDRDSIHDAIQHTRAEAEILDAGEHHPHRRIERHREDRGDRHREVLRVGERLEEPPLLVDEREHRQERDRDHQQREEDRGSDFL